MKIVLSICLGIFLCLSKGFSQQHPQVFCLAPDSVKLDSILELLEAADLQHLRIGEAAVVAGKMFLTRPYAEKTLEVNDTEKLVINLHGLDCTTFLETAVTLGRLIKLEHFSQSAYWRELAAFRYIDNWPDTYPSRLHYFSDWILTNDEKKRVCDITTMLGGISYEKEIHFMSSHPTAYAALEDSSFLNEITVREDSINKHTFHFIPKDSIATHETHIRDGDIIAITTNIKGLDIIHVGLAVWVEGRVHMLHASTNSKQVEITSNPLHDYMSGKTNQTGIMVARLVEP